MSGPTRGGVEGRVYLDLQNKARRDGRPNAELQQLYVLEGFLARLAGSPYRERFVLRGGVLLAAFGTRRPTRDVAEHRRVQLARLADVLDGYAALAQGKWGAWRRKQQMLDQPEQFNDLLQAVIAFADPALTGQVRGLTWNPTSRQWQPPTGA